MMNLDEIRRILEMVREHELTEFELENQGLKIRIKKDAVSISPAVDHRPPLPMSSGDMPAGVIRAGNPAPVNAVSVSRSVDPLPEEAEDLAVVKSPIVGTFYRSAEPGSPAFVEVGQQVTKGQVLCIIEAMKLMNEIDSEYDGEIVSIYIENGQPVQYGERLFAIRPV
jgi:acetyl-CoA carboxylase biotin carboxyl carrier protein